MLDSLLDGIKGQVASTLAEKAGLDMGQAEQAVPVAGESIKEGLMGAVSEGNVSDIMGMFSGGDMQQSSIFQKIAGIFTGKLGALGIGGGAAVSALALPMILNKIKGAASNDAGEMDASGLMGVLGGNAGGLLGGLTGGAGGMLGAAMGAVTGGAGAAGGVLGSVMGAVTGGAGDAAEGAGGALGGIMDAVKGGAGDAAGGAGGALGGVMDAVKGAGGDAAGGAGGILGNVMDAVTGGGDDAAEGAEGAGGLADNLKDKAADALKDGLGSIFGK